MTAQHQINSLKIDIKFSDCSSEERYLKKRSNKIFDCYVKPALEKLFDKYGNKDIFIPNIEINLGCLKSEEIKDAVYNALERQFTDYLNNNNVDFNKTISNCKETLSELNSDITDHTSHGLSVTENRMQLINYLSTFTRPWYLTSDEFNLKDLIENCNIDTKFLISILSESLLKFYQLISVTPISELNKWIKMTERSIIESGLSYSSEDITNDYNSKHSQYSKFIAVYKLLSILDTYNNILSGHNNVDDIANIKQVIDIPNNSSESHKNEEITFNKPSSIKHTSENPNSKHNAEQTSFTQKKVLPSSNNEKTTYNKKSDICLSLLFESLEINSDAELNNLRNHIKNAEYKELKYYTERLKKNILEKSEEVSKIRLKGKRIAIDNGGLVLFLPWLTALFNNLNYLNEDQQFKSIIHQERAVLILQYLTHYDEENLSPALFLNKLICGLPLLFPINLDIRLTEEEKTECKELITNIIEYWPSIRGTSIKGVQETFIRREGIIQPDKENWIIRIENKTVDILMQDIPWSYTVSSLPWNKYLIYTEWNI